MMPRGVDIGSESGSWIFLETVDEENSVHLSRSEKLLGFVPYFQATDVKSMENSTSLNHKPYTEDDITELMEEDVWGQDDDVSSIEGSTTPSSKQWPDSESCSHFSVLHDDGGIGSGRFEGSFSPSQFSPIARNDREVMCGQQICSLRMLASQYGASGTIKGIQHIVGTMPYRGRSISTPSYSPGDGPRSAPIEVPLWSRLSAQVDDSEEEDDINDVRRVPPHVFLAKQFTRSQGPAFSVIEGAGRTLKGRDASEVRDAVWKQTGFPG